MFKTILTVILAASCFNANAKNLMSPVTPIKAASDFTLNTPEDIPLSLSEFKGKFVLVNFWANWCSPCIKELPDMQNLYEHIDKSKFEIIGIHAGAYNDQAAEFIQHFGITFPIVSDPDTSLKGWDVPALPTSYLINPQGELVYQAIGPRSWDVEQMKTLLTPSPEQTVNYESGN